MQYRVDEKSGRKLSILGFGCMRFPRGINTKIDMEKVEKMILSAIEGGVNYFDTAYAYGGSEEALGEIIQKNNLRDKIFLATKLPHYKCKKYEDFETLFQTQLERLKTGTIDYYLIHNISEAAHWDGLREIGIENWIAEKKAKGQIGQIGFSFHGAQNEFFKLLDAYPWDFCQIQYNYLNENYQAGRAGLQKAHEMGMPVIIMEPLLGGKLAKGLPEAAVKRFTAADAGRSMAAWAMRWLWNQPEATVVLSGMSTAEQLSDNLKTAEDAVPGMCTEQEGAVYEAVKAILHDSYKVPCTGCNYCMPCPQRVNIPGCFEAYNVSYVNGFVTGMQLYATSTGLINAGKNYGARSCVKCGKCEKNCPQHIEIRKELEAVAKRMEPFWIQGILKVAMKFIR